MQTRDLLRPGGVVGVLVGLVGALVATSYGIQEEVKLSEVSGVVATDDGHIGAGAEIHLEVYNETNDLSGLVTFRTVADKGGRFRFRNVPEGFAVVRAYAPGYRAETGVLVGMEKGSLAIVLEWRGDQMQLATNQPVWTPDERPTLVINGMTRRKDVKLQVFGFDEKRIGETRDAYQLARDIAYNRYESDQKGPDPVPFQTITHQIKTRDIEGKYAETVQLPQLKEGIYVVKAETDDESRSQWIVVSRLGLVTKVSPKGVTGYVVDVASGKPLQGVDLSLVGPTGRKDMGKSDASGMARAANIPNGDGSYVMTASQGDSRAFSMFYWWSDTDGELAATHFTTDRPVYRPGDVVQFKGFVRVPTRDGYKLPTYRSVEVAVYDPDDTEMGRQTLALSAMGGFDGKFTTLKETTGNYRVEVVIDGQTSSEYVPVLAYRKPEFQIKVTPVRPYYFRGDKAEFKVKATYYTGEPVVGAELSAWATRADVWKWSPFDDEDYEWWAEEGEYSYGGEYLGDFDATTDENGEAVISVQTTQREDEEHDWWWTDSDQTYTLDVSASDASGRYFSGKGAVDVVRGDVDLSIAFEDYVVAPGGTARLKVRAIKYGTDQPASGATVHVEFGEWVWTRDKSQQRKRGEQDIRLDANGEGAIAFSPKTSGDYYARASVKDSGGRTVSTTDTVWAYAYGGSFAAPAPKLQLVLDKKQYRVGDTATAVVRTDKPGGTAWVTVESDDVLWSQLVQLDSETATVSIPVGKQFRPNASIEVCYIREKSFASSHRNLVVDLADDRLNVQVVPDKSVTLPGGTVAYTVTAKDAGGNPVQADVALSVVDEGVYAIKEDRTDPVKSFYPRRWTSVQTYYSFPEIYLDGDDKSPVNVQVRTDFRDTAFWAPSVVTDPTTGTASVTVKLPENLTSWRTTATAVTAGAQAGKGRTDVVARKPVMVRLSPPAFMVQDEWQQVGASVANETDTAQDFDVRLQSTGLTVQGNAVQRLTIAAHRSAQARWQVKAATPGAAALRVTAIATKTGDNDGMERTFEVKANGPTIVSYAVGDTSSSSSVAVQHDAKAVTGELTVSVSPSVLGTLVGSVDDLVDYPYGCVEQTMSRFLPAVVVRRFLGEAGINDPALDQKIQSVAADSMARLKDMQHGDGGFGWWAYDPSEADMTALVLEGLYYAKEAGLPVDQHMRDRAVEWGKEALKQYKVNDLMKPDYVRLAYALSLQGVSPSAWVQGLPHPFIRSLSARDLAYIVLALSVAKGDVPAEVAKFKDEAYKHLMERAVESQSTMSWESDWWYEPTAVAMQAVMKMEPNYARAGKAMRFLMATRRGRSWTSTRDTAQIVIAAIEYLKSSGEAKAPLDVTVTVAGSPHTFHFDAGDWSRQRTFTVPVKSLKAGSNQIEVRASGGGRAYVSAIVNETLYEPNAQATDSGHGMDVKREFFRMEARRMQDGSLQLVPGDFAVARAKPGEVLHCRLTIYSKQPREYVMVEDPALSNAHVVETGDIEEYDWHYWWSDQRFLDDHAAIFIRHLDSGVNVVEYTVRAEADGLSVALPATASMMYQPDIRARTATQRLEVRS